MKRKTRVLSRDLAAESAGEPLPAGMRLIPAGEFLSGDRKVPRLLRAFAIDELPVTEAQYKDFLREHGREPRPGGPGSKAAEFDAFPATQVTWYEADEYAQAQGKRLPTIYEWEKAARGTDGRKYPCGNELKSGCGKIRALEVARGEEAAAPAAVAVGSFPRGASPFGVQDMCGNVLNWTSSARRAGDRIYRAAKGASFMDGTVELARCTSVQYFAPDSTEPYIGFRCVKD